MYNPFEVYPQNDANDSDFASVNLNLREICPLCQGNKTESYERIKFYLHTNPSEIQALGLNSGADLILISGAPEIPQSEWIYQCPKCQGNGFILVR